MNGKEIVLGVLDKLINEREDKFDKAFVGALKEYVELGNKLSDLSWFNGVGFDKIGC